MRLIFIADQRRRSLSNQGIQLVNQGLTGAQPASTRSTLGLKPSEKEDAIRQLVHRDDGSSSSDKEEGEEGDANDADLLLSVRPMMPIPALHNPLDASLIVPPADKTFESKPFISMFVWRDEEAPMVSTSRRSITSLKLDSSSPSLQRQSSFGFVHTSMRKQPAKKT